MTRTEAKAWFDQFRGAIVAGVVAIATFSLGATVNLLGDARAVNERIDALEERQNRDHARIERLETDSVSRAELQREFEWIKRELDMIAKAVGADRERR